MRLAFVGIGCVLTGCGLISGLDGLTVTDASVDVSTPDGSDVAIVDASGSDIALDGSPPDAPNAPCDLEGGTFDCPQTCNGSCCLTSSGASCNVICSGTMITCTTSDECGPKDAGICCLENAVAQPACPAILSSSTRASCSDACKGYKLCVNDIVCPSGHCRLGVIAGTDASVGYCGP